MKEISALPVFVAIIEHGSFSEAAKHLGMTKSAVSKRLNTLEEQLGVKLLHRSTRKLSLTEAGEHYLEHARKAVQAAQDAENAATELQKTPSGSLKISTPMSLGRLHIAPLIPAFLEKYPQIKIKLDMSDLTRDIIAEGFDIAIRAGSLQTSNLVAKKIAPLRRVICASPTYLKQHGTPKIPADLITHNCVLFTYHTVAYQWTFIKECEEKVVNVSGNYQVNNSEALCKALIEGIGIGCLPTFVANEYIKKNKLCPILEDYKHPDQAIYVVYPQKQFLPEKVRVFIEFMTEQLGGDTPRWER